MAAPILGFRRALVTAGKLAAGGLLLAAPGRAAQDAELVKTRVVVVDVVSGLPVADARIEGCGLLEPRKALPPSPEERFRLVERTGDSGEAVVAWNSGARFDARLRVVAEGYTKLTEWLDAESAGGEGPLVFRLRRSAGLRGHLRCSGYLPSEVVVGLRAPAEALRRMSSPPYFRDEEITWTARVGAGGAFGFRELPSDVEMQLLVWLGKDGALLAPASVFLRPGETGRLELDWSVLATVSGRLLDQHGQGIPGAAVVAAPESWGRGQEARRTDVVLFGNGRRVVPRTWTDADGRFCFESLPPGEWIVGTYRRRMASAQNRVALSATRIEILPGQRRAEVEVVAAVGLEISGVLVDGVGKPWRRCVVWGVRVADGLGAANGWVRDDGSFRIRRLSPGRYRLYLADPAASDNAVLGEFEAGTTGLLLRSPRVAAAPEAPPGEAELWITVAPDSVSAMLRIEFQGREIRRLDLEPGLHRLAVPAGRLELSRFDFRGILLETRGWMAFAGEPLLIRYEPSPP